MENYIFKVEKEAPTSRTLTNGKTQKKINVFFLYSEGVPKGQLWNEHQNL